MGVAVDPAGAHMHPAAEIQDLLRRGRLRQGADGGYLALLDGDIDELAISLAPRSDDHVVHARWPLERRPAGRRMVMQAQPGRRCRAAWPQDGTAGDGFAPHVEQQRTQQGSDADRNRGAHGGEDDEGPRKRPELLPAPIMTSAP